MKKILITGGSGFIGRNLKEYLQTKYRILAPSHQKLDLLDQVQVSNFFKKNKIDFVIHCANIGGGRDTLGLKSVVETNLRMFFNLVKNSHLVEKIIHFGSGAEYDKSRPLKKIKEEDFGEKIPFQDYGFYKYVCSKYIEKVENIVNLRLFGVYGKYEDWRYKFISNSILKNLFKLDIVINQNVHFDYLYIDDLCKVLDYFLSSKNKYKFYNVTPTKSIDLLTISDIINNISNYKSKVKVLNRGLNYEYTGSNKRLKREIKGLSFTSYKKGIADLFDYYRRNLHQFDKNIIIKDEFLKYCRSVK